MRKAKECNFGDLYVTGRYVAIALRAKGYVATYTTHTYLATDEILSARTMQHIGVHTPLISYTR